MLDDCICLHWEPFRRAHLDYINAQVPDSQLDSMLVKNRATTSSTFPDYLMFGFVSGGLVARVSLACCGGAAFLSRASKCAKHSQIHCQCRQLVLCALTVSYRFDLSVQFLCVACLRRVYVCRVLNVCLHCRQLCNTRARVNTGKSGKYTHKLHTNTARSTPFTRKA